MADKPKTYAQQVHELKDIIVQKDEQIAKLQGNPALVTELQTKVADLEAELAARVRQDSQQNSSGKAQLTDAIQRAESAEQGLRNAQAKLRELEDLKGQLESQVNVFAMEADKTVGKDKKITALEETIKSLNFQVLQLQTRNRDLEQGREQTEADLSKKVNYYWALYQADHNQLEELKSRIRNAPDPFADLR